MGRWNFEREQAGDVSQIGFTEARPTFPTVRPPQRRGRFITTADGETVFRLPMSNVYRLGINEVKPGGLGHPGADLLGDVTGKSRRKVRDAERKP